MNIIEQLKYHDDNQLDEWLDLDSKATKRFSKDIVKFANENPDIFKHYCSNIIPSEYSSLTIVYEALSEYSASWNSFLGEEIKRVINLAKTRQIKFDYLEILEDIETEDLYSKDEDVYIDIVNFLTFQLDIANEEPFNLQLLSIISWFLIEYDEDDDISESKIWIQRVKNIADNALQPNVKLEARETLKNIDTSISFKPLSILENIKRLFK